MPIDAFEGVRFACISSTTLGTGDCYHNEAIFQSVTLCPGVKYQLTFSYYNISLRAGTINIALTNGLSNVSNLDPGEPCFSPVSNSQLLPPIVVPANTDPSNIAGWQTETIVFVSSSSANTQLVFWVNPDITDYEGLNVGLDAMSLVCMDSPLIPAISIQGVCPSYDFAGSTNNVPGVGVATWCWDFGDGTTGTGQQVSHTYAAEGTYQVCLTISDNCGGCIEKVCQSLICTTEPPPVGFACPCLGAGALNIDAGDPPTDPNQSITGLSVLATALSGGQTTQNTYNNTGKCIAIKGHLKVDNNFVLWINGGEIRMQPGAKIIVESGAELKLKGIKQGDATNPGLLGIHGCGKMWRSIVVNPGATLFLSDNIIQDAEYAVDIIGNFANVPSFYAVGNNFDRNHVGVRIFQTVAQPFPNSFQNNTFQATNGLWPAFSSDITNFIASHPYAGMELRSTTFNVGQSGIPTSDNLFKGLRNGILAYKSNLYVYYAQFMAIWGTVNYNQEPDWSSTNLQGYGIAIRGQALTVHNSIFGGEGSNGWRGISATSCKLDTKRNDIYDLISGIFVSPGSASNIVIDENKFRVTLGGWGTSQAAFVINGPAPNASIRITNNNPVQIMGNGPGIWVVNNGLINNPALRQITGNHIFDLAPGYAGISVDNSGRWTIDDNHIFTSGFSNTVGGSGLTQGILLDASDYCIVRNNDVHALDGTLASAYMNAIDLRGSEHCTLCCNLTENSSAGNYFMGMCDPVTLRHEQIMNHGFGLYCDGIGTSIGDQPWAGNQWLGVYNNLGALHTGSIGNIAASEFFIEGPQTTNFWPQSRFPNGQDEWFRQLSGSSHNCSIVDANCSITPMVFPAPPRDLTDSERKIATNTYSGSHLNDRTTQLEGERGLYREMRLNPSLLGQYTAADQFFANANTSYIRQMYQVETETYSLIGLTQSEQNRKTQIEQTLDSLSIVRAQIDLLFAGTLNITDTLYLINWKKACTSATQPLLDEWISISNNATSALMTAALAISSQNNAIVSNTIWGNNRKTVNRIYLETISIGNYLASNQQLNDLLSVANQCMLSGGDAVLQARTLYNTFVSTPLVFDDVQACGLEVNPRDKYHEVSENTGKIHASIVPNPALNTFIVSSSDISEGEMLQVQIINTSGMLEKDVFIANGSAITGSFKPGLYLCRIYIGGVVVDTVKLIIVP